MAAVRRAFWSVWAVFALLIAAPAVAQLRAEPTSDGGALRVERFDVEQVARLEPGADLNFSLFGTPGAAASLRIEGADRVLVLREVEPGVYEGAYTIGIADRIEPGARVRASLQHGPLVARALLEEPLQIGAAPPVASSAPPPPRAARVEAAPVATLPVEAAAHDAADRPRGTARCADCAVVESVRVVEVEPRNGTGTVGAVSGGLLGAIIANHFAEGPGRHLARIVGAIGGALAGREIERQSRREVRYDVWLRKPDGALEIRSYANRPPYQVGDRIRTGSTVLAGVRRSAAPF